MKKTCLFFKRFILFPVVPIFLTIPNYFAMQIKAVSDDSPTVYIVSWSPWSQMYNRLLFRTNIWLYSFILKLVPCIALTIITGFLIRALYKAEERSARLKNGMHNATYR